MKEHIKKNEKMNNTRLRKGKTMKRRCSKIKSKKAKKNKIEKKGKLSQNVRCK